MNRLRYAPLRALLGCVGLALAVPALAQQDPVPAADAPPPERPLLYFFEHVTLREAAFSYDPDMQALIADPRNATQPVARIFSKAALMTVGMPGVDVEHLMDDVGPYMREISFETLHRGGYTIHVMGMPAPEHPPEAYFVGIVYKDGEPLAEGQTGPSTRYFTFEQTTVDNHEFAFGEWDADGEHTTHGFGDRVPDVRDFIATVYANLGIITPNLRIDDLTLMRWLDRYGEAWETKDPELAAALFTDDATYQETPYDEPLSGRDAIREYWAGVTADQDGVEFSAEILALDGITAVAGWSARFRSIENDAPVELNGVFVLEFEDAETVRSLREWWHLR